MNPYSAPIDFDRDPTPPTLAFDVRTMFVMSAVLGSIGYIIGLAGSLFAKDASWSLRLILAGIPAFCAFVASCFLCVRDHFGVKSTLRFVHRQLLARNDMTIQEFAAMLPGHDSKVLTALRESVAAFFHVPAAKIYPTDTFTTDYLSSQTDPALRHFVVASTLRSLNIVGTSASFNPYSANLFSEFAALFEQLPSN